MYYMLTFPALPQPRCPRYFIELQLHQRISPQACFPHRNKTVTQMFLFPRARLTFCCRCPCLLSEKVKKFIEMLMLSSDAFVSNPVLVLIDRMKFFCNSEVVRLWRRKFCSNEESSNFELVLFHGGLLLIWPNYPYRFFLYFVLYLVHHKPCIPWLYLYPMMPFSDFFVSNSFRTNLKAPIVGFKRSGKTTCCEDQSCLGRVTVQKFI